MEKANKFDIDIAKIGDQADITVVTNGTNQLSEAIAGFSESMKATTTGTKISLTPESRTIKRLRYYDGLTIMFIADKDIVANTITEIDVDGMGAQAAQLELTSKAGEYVTIVYSANKFKSVLNSFPKITSIDSNSELVAATAKSVKMIHDMFKPRVGYIYMTAGSENPAQIWAGTVWKKIEGRMLIGSSSKYAVGTTGGSETKTIAKENLPNTKIRVDNHTHDMQHTHPYSITAAWGDHSTHISVVQLGDPYQRNSHDIYNGATGGSSRSSTGGASPYTSPLGSGHAMDVMNPYKVVNIYERIS